MGVSLSLGLQYVSKGHEYQRRRRHTRHKNHTGVSTSQQTIGGPHPGHRFFDLDEQPERPGRCWSLKTDCGEEAPVGTSIQDIHLQTSSNHNFLFELYRASLHQSYNWIMPIAHRAFDRVTHAKILRPSCDTNNIYLLDECRKMVGKSNTWILLPRRASTTKAHQALEFSAHIYSRPNTRYSYLVPAAYQSAMPNNPPA